MDLASIHYRTWFYFKEIETCVCVPAKCGGTSFYKSFIGADCEDQHARSAAVSKTRESGAGPYDPWQIIHFNAARKIISVRDPVSRFASLWRDKFRSDGVSPRQLLETIKSFPFGDPHWTPQYFYMVPGATPIPYTMFPAVLGYSGHSNKTELLPDDPEMPIDEILILYAHDKILFEAATNG